jgi:hypothetical protein
MTKSIRISIEKWLYSPGGCGARSWFGLVGSFASRSPYLATSPLRDSHSAPTLSSAASPTITTLATQPSTRVVAERLVPHVLRPSFRAQPYGRIVSQLESTRKYSLVNEFAGLNSTRKHSVSYRFCSTRLINITSSKPQVGSTPEILEFFFFF